MAGPEQQKTVEIPGIVGLPGVYNIPSSSSCFVFPVSITEYMAFITIHYNQLHPAASGHRRFLPSKSGSSNDGALVESFLTVSAFAGHMRSPSVIVDTIHVVFLEIFEGFVWCFSGILVRCCQKNISQGSTLCCPKICIYII